MSERDAMTVVERVEPSRALEPRNFQEGMQMAKIVAMTGLYGVKTPEDAFVRMSTGMALGLSAPQALRGLFVISGKVGIAADLMMALALRHPECRYFRCVETNVETATFATQRAADPEMTLTFTMQEAVDAGLMSNANYKRYPAAMLRARCIAALARLVYPEVMHGLYVPEELSAERMSAERRDDAPVTPRVSMAQGAAAVVAAVDEAKLPRSEGHRAPQPQPAPVSHISAAEEAATVEQAEAALAALSPFDARSRARGWFALVRVSPIGDLPAVRDRAVEDIHHPQFTREIDTAIAAREASA